MAFGSIMSQKPNVYTDDEVLTDETKAIYGLGPEAVPDDVFIILGIGAGKYGYGITVTYPDGTPAANLPVSGVTDRLGQPITTNDKGYFLAVSTAKSITFSIVSPYFDVNGISNQTINSESIITKKNMSLPEKTYTNYVLVQNTQTIKFFKDRTVDFTAVGGGGGGTGLNRISGQFSTTVEGSGGGGGYVKTILSKTIKKNQEIVLTIGSGGSAYAASYINGSSGRAQNGGTTTVTIKNSGEQILQALGGYGGNSITWQRSSERKGAMGGAGNGNGSNSVAAVASNGTSGTGYIFNNSSLGLAGGGGGGGFKNASNSAQGYFGGSPYGANGGYNEGGISQYISYVDASLARGPGGGGGSGYGNQYGNQDKNWGTAKGSNGAPGGVYIRWK